MKTENYDIVGSYNNQRVTSIDGERSVNLFEYVDPLGKKDKSLLSTSGLLNSGVTFGSTTGGFRGQFTFLGNMYVVIGTDIYLITPSLAASKLNSSPLNTSSGYVGIDANTHQVIFVDGVDGYIWDTNTTTFTLITDINFPVLPLDVCFLDGFFIVASGGTNTFVLSQLNDGLSYTPLQQGAITSHPGTIVACRTLHRRLFLFSQFFTEVWENAGIGTNLPFRRNNSLLMEYGTPAIGSIAVGFDKMFFLSQDRDGLGSVMEVLGTQSIPVSTRALDFQLAQYAAAQVISDCRSFLIKENGLIFYRMNFTEANHTFIYNVSLSNPTEEQTKYWHEEEVLNHDRHPAQTHAYFNGINYVGNYKSPIMYETDSDISTNDGEPIRRMRIARPIVPPGYQRIRVDRFQLDLLQGNISQLDIQHIPLNLFTENNFELETQTGDNIILEQDLTFADAMTPYVFLSLSKDGGQTFGYLVKSPMGQVGQRSFRTVWRKLGTVPRGQAFVPKIEFFNTIPFIIMGASWAYEILPE